MKRMACALALAAGTGLTLGVATRSALAQPNPATAVSGLKLSVVPLGSLNADTPVALDVNFRGGRVRSVEVYLDGNRIAKETINTVDTHGVLSFKLPASLLAEGAHEIMIQATDKDGSTATTTTRLHVKAPEQDTMAHFLTPKRNAMVKEFTPIEVKLDDGIKDAYVMFFLDGAFLSARNYSPYIYTLDTSKFDNGSHTIKIEVWDSTGASMLKTLSMPVRINKSGGFTSNQKDTPGLGNGKTSNPNLPELSAVFGHLETSPPLSTLSSLSRFGSNASSSMSMRSSAEPRSGYVPVRPSIAVSGISILGTINSELSLLDTAGDLARMENGSAAGLHSTAAAPSGKLTPEHVGNADGRSPVRVTPLALVTPVMPGVLSDLAGLNTPTDETTHVARQAVHVRRAGNVAARPSLQLEGNPAPVAFHAAPVAKSGRGHGPSRSMHNTHVKTFDVAFDSTQIAFDVPPRIENGLPLAPFRAIFEHSGGTVKWYGESKTVRAINNRKEIEIHIGDNQATVNNQKVKLDAKAYIDRGRTIVPLSFVRDAMDVKVSYDAHTGHVLIESNK